MEIYKGYGNKSIVKGDVCMDKDKKAAILKAAKNEFLNKGYQKASVARIASAAGVSIGTLYSYFKNKEGLFAIIERPELKDYNPDEESKKLIILKTALKVFGKNGYASTTMEAVADSCGFSKTVLYQYFKSKEELFVSIFYEPQFICTLENLRFTQTDTELLDILKNTGTQFLKLFEDPARLNIIKMVISEANRFPQLGSLMYENSIEKVSGYMADILKDIADRGIIAEMDFKLAARSYFGLLYSFVLTDKIMNPCNDHFSNAQIIDFAAAIFEKGMQI